MEKYISVNKETMAKLQKVFKVTERCVRNALTFRSKSDLARKIRFVAEQNGGVTYVVAKEMECFFDSDSCMHQLFPNGAELYFDKIEGEVKLIHKGDIVRRWGNIHLTDIPELQATAAAL